MENLAGKFVGLKEISCRFKEEFINKFNYVINNFPIKPENLRLKAGGIFQRIITRCI